MKNRKGIERRGTEGGEKETIRQVLRRRSLREDGLRNF